MPDTPEHQRQELVLRMILATVVSATRGFGAAELVQTLLRARALCRALHDDATLVSVLVGLGRYYDLLTDGEAIEQHTDEELRLLDRVQELYAPQWHQELVLRYSLAPAVLAGVIAGCSL